MGYFSAAVKGFGWQTALKVAIAVVTLVKISLLARLLSPTEFGVFSLVLITLGVSEAMTQTGVNLTILQSEKPVSYFLDTAWVIAIVRGIGIGTVMVLMGFGFQRYFHQSELLGLIALTALVPIIKGFINPAIVGLHKDLHFFSQTMYFFAITAVETALAILLAAWLHSVLALVLSLIGAAIFEVIISMLFFELRPTFRYLHEQGNIILGQAKWLSLSSLMGYLNDNLDDFIVGSTTNTHQLGLYHNAYAVSHKLNYDMARSVHHGTLPIFTKLQHDTQRLRTAFIKTIATNTAIATGVSIPLLLFPNFLVSLLLGDQWLAIIPLLPWLVLAGITHSVALTGYTLFLAKGSYRSLNIHQGVNLGLMVFLMFWLSNEMGLVGAVIGLAVARLLAFPIILVGSWLSLSHEH